MADYSEFPTTPTAWQDQIWPEPVTTDEPAPPEPQRPRPDLLALIPGVAFLALAVLGLSGLDLAADWLWGGVVGCLVLIGGGSALLVAELRRQRRRTS